METSGSVFFFARGYDEAIEQYEKALELDPRLGQTLCMLGLTYAYKLMPEPAVAASRKGVELVPGASFLIALLGDTYASAGYRDEAHKILEELREVSKQRYVTPYAVGRIYAALDMKDEAFQWLETAYRDRAALVACLKADPRLDNLRADPRFKDLLRRMNFPA